MIKKFQHIKNQNKWKNLYAVLRIESCREFKNSEKPNEKSIRYYITSLDATAKEFEYIIRSYWSIENKLHWVLDIAFLEDQSRKRDGNAA
jgi:predicted transposase YbfD/YdcC